MMKMIKIKIMLGRMVGKLTMTICLRVRMRKITISSMPPIWVIAFLMSGWTTISFRIFRLPVLHCLCLLQLFCWLTNFTFYVICLKQVSQDLKAARINNGHLCFDMVGCSLILFDFFAACIILVRVTGGEERVQATFRGNLKWVKNTWQKVER